MEHGELFESEILVFVQPFITRLCPLHVHRHGFIIHNRFTTINRWSKVHFNIHCIVTTNFAATIYHGDISFCFARYRCNKVSLERYLGEILRRLYRYLADLSFWRSPIRAMFPWYIGDKSREQSTIFVDYCLHYFWTVLYQQAYNWLIGWMNHFISLYNRLGQYSIILYVLLSSICVHRLPNAVSSKWSESLIHCLLVTVYVWYFIQRKCKWLVQHLSVNLEKACVTVFNMYHITKNSGLDEIKCEYSISHASYYR